MHYLQVIVAYILWGIFPLYWKLLPSVNSFEIICHRILWSLLTLVLCVTLVRQWSDIREVSRDRNRLGLCGLAALLISTNWFVFIWAVQHGYVVEGSLGYFINPLLNVVLGVFFFRERLSPIQWIAIGVAAFGVFVMTLKQGSIPWVALSLALSFALYAVVKKKTTLPAIAGLGMETAILMPIALGYVGYITSHDWDLDRQLSNVPLLSTAGSDPKTWVLLILGGPITTLPLVLFAAAAKKVPLVAMGMLQYIAPTMQFLLGWFLFSEIVDGWRLFGFVCVWSALAILSAHAVWKSQ